MWAALDAALEAGAAAQRDREIGQASLFGGGAGARARRARAAPRRAEWTDRQRLEDEKEVLGFYVTGHPLAAVAAQLARFADTRGADTAGTRGPRGARGGIVTALRETRTRRGALMAFGTLEDLEGSFDLVIFAEPYAQLRAACSRPPPAARAAAGRRPLLVTRNARGRATRRRSWCATWSPLERAEEKLASAAARARPRRGGDARPADRAARAARARTRASARSRCTW